jgi:hypothetical protein
MIAQSLCGAQAGEEEPIVHIQAGEADREKPACGGRRLW